jgi:CHAD domain-containing protein
MIQEQIDSYFGNLIHELSVHLQTAGLPQSTETVHDTRVCIKRIYAFLKVLGLDRKNKRIRKLLKKYINNIFNSAGKLRDDEIRLYLLKDYENLLEQNYSKLEKKLNERIDKGRQNLRRILSATNKEFLNLLQEEARSEMTFLSEEVLKETIHNYLDKAIRKTRKNRQRIIPKILHRQRRLLKEIRFCMEMTEDTIPVLSEEEQISSIKEMEDLLGSWHDYTILNKTVEKLMQKLKDTQVDEVIKMNALAQTISSDIILLLDKYRKAIAGLEIKL